jgi:hypothetical protein
MSDKQKTCPIPGSYAEPEFATIEDALDDRMVQIQKRLLLNEDLMMTYILREDIHHAYYRLWLEDANRYFRNICAVKRRRATLKKSA